VAVYIVIGLVLLAGLAAAYRSLGSVAAQVVDPASLMRAVLDGAATAAALPVTREAARVSRRRLEACAQQLEAVDEGALEGSAADARALLQTALDELGWWARICESEPHAAATGLRRACDGLREDALRCLDEAGRLLAAGSSSDSAEVGERLL